MGPEEWVAEHHAYLQLMLGLARRRGRHRRRAQQQPAPPADRDGRDVGRADGDHAAHPAHALARAGGPAGRPGQRPGTPPSARTRPPRGRTWPMPSSSRTASTPALERTARAGPTWSGAGASRRRRRPTSPSTSPGRRVAGSGWPGPSPTRSTGETRIGPRLGDDVELRRPPAPARSWPGCSGRARCAWSPRAGTSPTAWSRPRRWPAAPPCSAFARGGIPEVVGARLRRLVAADDVPAAAAWSRRPRR